MSSALDSLFSQIEEHYRISLPMTFRDMWRRGWGSNEDFFLPEMRWIPLEEIRDYQFDAYHLPGFIPFATNASGDLWCWQPALDSSGEPRVVECPHDCEEGSVYALDFTSALYRHFLDGLAIHAPEAADVAEQVAFIGRCVDRYRPLLLSEHVRNLGSLLDRPVQFADLPSIGPGRRLVRWHFLIQREEHSRMLSREFPEGTFRWMRPAYP